MAALDNPRSFGRGGDRQRYHRPSRRVPPGAVPGGSGPAASGVYNGDHRSYHPAVKGITASEGAISERALPEVADLRTYTGSGGSREHHDELRARGLAAAGEVVALD